MGLPSINITFKETASTAIQRGARGIVALILKDTVPTTSPIFMSSVKDIPTSLTAANREQIQLAFMGYEKPPLKVIAYIEDTTATDYTAAQTYLETAKWDYVAVPEIADSEVTTFATWIKSLRDTMDKKVKAVLPNCTADHEGIINFASDNIKTSSKTYDVKEYCSRIAGLLAGTPLTISATYATLPEVVDCDHLSSTAMDAAIDAGKFILMNDGEKVKVARAVNSLTTTTATKGNQYKKIKVVDTMDLIHDDIKATAQDKYIGKVPNDYDHKVLLASAIGAYYDQLELDGLLDKGKNSINVDVDAQEAYLKGKGVDTENMTVQEIKEANTEDKVFLASSVKILDVMEDITLNITI
jgi:hypothetical protein